MSLRVEPLAPTLHLTLCVVTSSLGRDQTVVIPQSWKGARPGWGQKASRGTISPLSSISKYIIYEPPHLGAPSLPGLQSGLQPQRATGTNAGATSGPLSSAELGWGTHSSARLALG